MKKRILNLKNTLKFFSAVLFFTGFYLSEKNITGNMILNNSSGVNPYSLIGVIFIGCSVALAVYSLKK